MESVPLSAAVRTIRTVAASMKQPKTNAATTDFVMGLVLAEKLGPTMFAVPLRATVQHLHQPSRVMVRERVKQQSL
jgi:hypothetical protein